MAFDAQSWEDTKKFYLKIFSAIDEDVNGYLSDREFKKFLISADIQMTHETFNEIYDRCNDASRGKLRGLFTFDDFVQFMDEYRAKLKNSQMTRISLYAESKGTVDKEVFEKLFDEIDVDKSGSISFREIMVFCKKKGIRIGYGEIMAFMKYFDESVSGELSFDTMKERLVENQGNLTPGMAFIPEAPTLCSMIQPIFSPVASKDKKLTVRKNCVDLRQSFLTLLKPKYEDEMDPKEVENMRWATFIDFQRKIADEDVMTAPSKIVKGILPGKYQLNDLADFQDLPELKPRYTEIRNVVWKSGSKNIAGTIDFPASFDGLLEVEFATNELLEYYGCSIANTRHNDEIELDMRHAIQDFTYMDNYLEKYVLSPKSAKGNGGAGVERHDFDHLDCPLQQNNGFFILGKHPDDDESVLHLTAFRIPVRHTLYIPGGTIHSNDYLKGTWRTMLSDAAPIDYVHLRRQGKNFAFTFKKFV